MKPVYLGRSCWLWKGFLIEKSVMKGKGLFWEDLVEWVVHAPDEMAIVLPHCRAALEAVLDAS